MGTNYDDDQEYYDNFLILPLPDTILPQTQWILQAFFANFTIFFTLYSHPSTQIRGYLLLNYQCESVLIRG
ncbi:hypothetical protein ES703_124347 [subsurface metagenome]